MIEFGEIFGIDCIACVFRGYEEIRMMKRLRFRFVLIITWLWYSEDCGDFINFLV